MSGTRLLAAAALSWLWTIAGARFGYCAAAVDTSGTVQFTGPSWGQFLKVALILVVVILLVWVSLSLLRRTMGFRGGRLSGVELLGGVALGPRRSIQFIKVGGSLYLIGATDHHLGLIATIDDPQTVQRIIEEQTSASREPFAALIRRLSRRNEGGKGRVG